jgi:hypothetical protein
MPIRGQDSAGELTTSSSGYVLYSVIAIFFVLLLVGFWAATRVELLPDQHMEITSPTVTSGDEPHHLMVVNSLLFDHDFELQDDYKRAETGMDAGGIPLLDHHTIIVNQRTGAHGTWFEHHLDPDLTSGPDVYEVSSHPMAYPALLAALIFPFHPKMDDVQRDASLVMVLICWLGAIFTFLLARKVGLGSGYALLATSVLALASPWLIYNRSFFAEPAIGLSVVIALYALESERPVLAGSAAAAAAFFKPPMAVIGVGFVIDRILRKRWREVIVLLSVLGLFGLILVTFNYWLARTLIISGNLSGPWPFGTNTAHDFHTLGETFIASDNGLFIWAPWTIFAIFPIGKAFCSIDAHPRFLREMSLPMAMQLAVLAASNFEVGSCVGPRYWVPFLPWMAVAAVYTIRSTGWSWKIIFLLLAIVSAAISIVATLRYPQMFSLSPWYLWHPEQFVGGKSLF